MSLTLASMSAEHREKSAGPEESRATVRALYVSQLEAAGSARFEALRQADAHLDRIARLIPDAANAGLSVTDVARITGVSRPTLYQLRARYGESHRHLRLAVLHAVTNTDGSLNAIVRSVGRPKGDISRVLWDFVDGGVLEVEPVEDEEGTEPAFLLTPKGDVLMDVWHYEEDDEAESDAR